MGLRWPKGAVCSMGPRASARSTNGVKSLVHNDFGVGAFVPFAAKRRLCLGPCYGNGDALAECIAAAPSSPPTPQHGCRKGHSMRPNMTVVALSAGPLGYETG